MTAAPPRPALQTLSSALRFRSDRPMPSPSHGIPRTQSLLPLIPPPPALRSPPPLARLRSAPCSQLSAPHRCSLLNRGSPLVSDHHRPARLRGASETLSPARSRRSYRAPARRMAGNVHPAKARNRPGSDNRSEEHTSELQSLAYLV